MLAKTNDKFEKEVTGTKTNPSAEFLPMCHAIFNNYQNYSSALRTKFNLMMTDDDGNRKL